MKTFRQWLIEAKHPIPPLAQWQKYPEETKYDWNGHKKPTLWYRHDLPVNSEDRYKLRPSGANQPRYVISYNDPETKDIIGPKGQFLGTQKSGHDYTAYYYKLDADEHRQYHQEIGRYKKPEEAYKAILAHYDKLNGITRTVRQPKPKVDRPLPPTERIQYPDSSTDSDELSKADNYFGIGHGESDEGNHEPYIVWAQINGRIEKSEKVSSDRASATHGSRWGHDITNRDFKGRYEPRTGRLSIVVPRHMEHRELPNDLLRRLHSAFRKITQIHEF